MIYAGVALCILAGAALWLYAANARRTAEHVNAELAAPAYPDPPRRQPQTVAPVSYAPTVITQTPTGTARSVQADVVVPALHSFITGAIGAILGLGVAALGDWSLWRLALVGFVLGLAIDWFLSWRDARRLLWKVEKIVGRSLDGDPYVGQPPDTGHVLLVNPDKARAQVAKSQAETARRVKTSDLLTFWTRCHTVGTAQRAHGIEAGSGVALARYEEMRDTLLRLGLAEWKNPASPKAGWRVVVDMAEGGALLARHVKEQHSST